MSCYDNGVNSIDELEARRRRNWCQDGELRIENPEQARQFIERVGIATLYAASSEFPSLYQGFMSDPNPPSFASWDSPSGEVYTWRWALGRPHAAFYGVLVAKKPTWVAFDRLPKVLAAFAERRSPRELFASGQLSSNALAVVTAFEGTDGVLSTKELRSRAGFEKGKESRAAYLKAVEELDLRLWLAKRFSEEEQVGDEMLHAWVTRFYQDAHEASAALDPDIALGELLIEWLEHAAFLDPKILARHLRISPGRLESVVTRLKSEGVVSWVEEEKRRWIVGT